MRSRGDITVWLSEDAIAQWYADERVYDGTGTPLLYTDFAILICHEIRQVYRVPLRQTQGFIDSLFRLLDVRLFCPDYRVLSKRLRALKIKMPRYRKTDKPVDGVHAAAVDSTGLKRFGRGEWHNEKYQLSNKASWRKFHTAVNQNHYFEACTLTDSFAHDDTQVAPLLAQIDNPIDHFTGDGAYNETPVYDAVTAHSPNADVVISPRSNATEKDNAAPLRNRTIREIEEHGRMHWQRNRQYGLGNRASNWSNLQVS